jgi:hypothetical protein
MNQSYIYVIPLFIYFINYPNQEKFTRIYLEVQNRFINWPSNYIKSK